MNEEEYKQTYNRHLDGLIGAYDTFEKMGLKPMVFGATLLGIIRNNNFIIPGKGIIDLACKAELITPEVWKEIQDCRFYGHKSGEVFEYPLMYFNFTYGRANSVSVELMPLYKINKRRAYNIQAGKFLSFPAKLFKRYSYIKFAGRTWRTMSDPKKWLRLYYGDDWKTPNPGFAWPKSKALRRNVNFL